jgi:hypothetical protein
MIRRKLFKLTLLIFNMSDLLINLGEYPSTTELKRVCEQARIEREEHEARFGIPSIGPRVSTTELICESQATYQNYRRLERALSSSK